MYTVRVEKVSFNTMSLPLQSNAWHRPGRFKTARWQRRILQFVIKYGRCFLQYYINNNNT